MSGALTLAIVFAGLFAPIALLGWLLLPVSLARLRESDPMPIVLYLVLGRLGAWKGRSSTLGRLGNTFGSVVMIGFSNLPAAIVLGGPTPMGPKLAASAFFLVEAVWLLWFVRLVRRMDKLRGTGK